MRGRRFERLLVRMRSCIVIDASHLSVYRLLRWSKFCRSGRLQPSPRPPTLLNNVLCHIRWGPHLSRLHILTVQTLIAHIPCVGLQLIRVGALEMSGISISTMRPGRSSPTSITMRNLTKSTRKPPRPGYPLQDIGSNSSVLILIMDVVGRGLRL